ncbi:YkoF family thiamine/hydroxymethylpyrimidine-binding protein [Aquibacillus rhizosphaerae]|uniref:YkoF family thiamine/hydroxymethylpyrimidine-binding protein n=1 Tax=Aquibacillus rhizosphaerae TaxID=3051431 RepID=A0ABT7L9Y1_9BACI|nr:YkoF family thiamine/hydroxymethylpyrimidine-binding protein [Aquibacillus sp. LR5S19]MDL4842194.1 YkoF family thiamine/hydroxymethylpyrimidine-binding protein [Aquibacillus sp. LR5S19]
MSNFVCESNRIAGVSFSVHPMSDRFVEIITTAIEHVDTSKVWINTDDVTTLVRGRITHVFDVTKAIFLQAAKSGVHVVFNATYSVGCPGDTAGDVYMAEDDSTLNNQESTQIKQEVATKFALYPLGGGDYMNTIYSQIEAMKQYVHVSGTHYATRLDGDANDVFNGLEKVFIELEEGGSTHTVMTITMSANSPSVKGGNE